MIKPYTELAESYDYLLKHVDYDQWYRYISSIMIKYINNPRVVVELGCGTGKFGSKFSADEFMIIGIDKSIEMLKIASIRAYRNVKIICADMRNFRLSKPVDFIFSVHDTMNYLLTYRDIKDVLRSVKKIMHNESVFMFDITTEYNIKKNFDGKVSRYNFKGYSIEWSNSFDSKKLLVLSTLRFKNDNGNEKIEEHVQRIYSISEMSRLLMDEGFEIIGIFGDYSFNEPVDKTIMVNFITRKKG